ncbi:MAG TPA: nickel-dependent lactate racemase [Bacillota bacterium]|nr:nickel-dependent lactate racemase [Bacillota bacterium]
MQANRVALPWGGERTLSIPLPPGWNYMGAILPAAVPPVGDFPAALKKALANPAGKAGLDKMNLSSSRVAVVVDDFSRPTPVPQIFPEVLAGLLRAGARAGQITVVMSLGTHRPMTGEEITGRLGRVNIEGCRVVNHDCRDAGMLTRVGRTAGGTEVVLNRYLCEADLVVLIGTIEPHPLTGFGGGLKNVVPGCAGLETIASTHLRVEARRRFGCTGLDAAHCPTRRDIEEGAMLLDTDYFLVNTVLTPEGEVAGVFCGDPVEAHRKGCQLAAKIYGAPVEEKADILLLGSHPMDTDLRQGVKCLANALGAAREGALMIGFLRCRTGVGDMIIPKKYLSADETRLLARRIGTEAFVKEREKTAGIPTDMDDRYMQQFLCEIARRHRVLVYSPDLPPDTGERLGYFELFSDLSGLMERAAKLAPEGTVLSSPLGGICYPRTNGAFS